MQLIKETLNIVHNRIKDAASLSSRNANEITLLAVSKRQPVEKIREAYTEGQLHFGENYLQEALQKQDQLKNTPLVWHFIGPIQSNKTKAIASHFDWVHSVDRIQIAKRLSSQRPEHLPPLNICIQINIDNEASKSGIMEDQLVMLTKTILQLPNLKLRGLMIIPKAGQSSEQALTTFRRTAQIKSTLNQVLKTELDTLSMGMSADLDEAIAAGATIVRIGTAIFGQRH